MQLKSALQNAYLLAPLTRGGNLPFRRLCAELGADITLSEMAYARFINRGEGRELALIRRHSSERIFGAQIAAKSIDEGSRTLEAIAERGADFVDINCGCPIHDTVRRGLGAHLLRRPKALGKFISGLTQVSKLPITVKIRTGWSNDAINVHEVCQILEESGAAAITVHGRTREQRYTRAANWELIGEVVKNRNIPIIGNGDILTHYEAQYRKAVSGCSAVMIGRGALIKPWIFQELREGRALNPTSEERVQIYWRLAQYMKEHFHNDEKGKRRAWYFLPWHFSFFCRYRPWEQSSWEERARSHPLIQTRPVDELDISPLESLLRSESPAVHEQISAALWESESYEDALGELIKLSEGPQEIEHTTETADILQEVQG
jgi:tRNA-dihydrouridine synthase 3